MDEAYMHQNFGVRWDEYGNLRHDPLWFRWSDQNPPVRLFEREIAAYLPSDGGDFTDMTRGIVIDFAKHYLDVCLDIVETRQMYRVLLRLKLHAFVMRRDYLSYDLLIQQCNNFEVRRYCEMCHCPVYFQPADVPARIFCEPCRTDHARKNPPLHTLKYMPYKDYLHTDHWKRIREAALDHAGYHCQVCNNEGELNVHHRTYERRGEELPTDLTVLCVECHKVFHQHGRMPL